MVGTLPSTFQPPASSIRDLLIPQMEVRFSPPERSRIKPSKRSLGRLTAPKSSELMELMEPTLNLLDLKNQLHFSGLMGGVFPLVVNVMSISSIHPGPNRPSCGCREIYPFYPPIKQLVRVPNDLRMILALPCAGQNPLDPQIMAK